MTPRPSRLHLLWLPFVLAALLAIYLPGMGSHLVFDDQYLASGRLLADYAAIFEWRERMLSYGSFVWIQDTFGEGWWKQRLVNLALHVAVVVALWALWREILRHIEPPLPEPGSLEAPLAYDRSPALGFAVGFFALNPVAVYAVAYLVQRSILMATLFVVLALWLFVRAVAGHKPWLHLAALACYALGVMSKEYAIMAPLAAVPLYILAARPPARRLAVLGAAGAVLAAAAGFALWTRYGHIIGKPFDEYSHVYLAQLAALDPDAPSQAFPLSILNQSWLFFQYGLRWLLPAAAWMSINLRPPFPVSLASFPHVLGAVGYAAVVAGGFFLLLRHRDWKALVGVALLLPALLFATEFLTVWVQDPFVLYRSYLWAIGIPGLVFILAHGMPGRVLAAMAVVVGGVLVWQSLDRVFSLATPVRAWTDAIAKLPGDPRAVGRWFPYVNRGAAYVGENSFNLAMSDFEIAASLGDMGIGHMNRGSLYAANGEHEKALASFAVAERQGFREFNLPFQRGLAYAAMGNPAAAYRELQAARAMNPPSPTRELALLHLGRIGLQLGRGDEALEFLGQLLRAEPGHRDGRYYLAMTHLMKGDPARALEVIEGLSRDETSVRVSYARALAAYRLNRKADALAAIRDAIGRGGENAHLREWREKIEALP